MRKALVAALAFYLAPFAASACDDHVGKCKVEAWRWSGPARGYLKIDGAATCDSGMIAIRVYEGEGGRFLGVATGIVEGHAFEAIATDVMSAKAVAIKYSIRPR